MISLITPKDAAHALGITVRHLSELVAAGEIPFVPIGLGDKRLRRRFDPSDLEAFIAARKCRSTNEKIPTKGKRKATPTTSAYEIVDFAALREQRRSAKRSAPKRQRNK